MQLPKTNIVIVTWNALEYTKNTINSLFENTDIPYYLTIVDNGSDQDTVDYLQNLIIPKNCAGYRPIFNEENLGPGRAMSIGYKTFNTPYTCLANNDVLFSIGWLKELENTIASDPLLGIVAPLRPSEFVKHPYIDSSVKRVVAATPDSYTIQQECNEFTQGKSMSETISDIIRINGGGIEYLTIPPNYISTCTALVNNSIIDKIGGIADPIFKVYGTEDIDLSWRIGTSGYRAAWARNTYVHHFRHKSANSNKLNLKECVLRNNQIFYEKWKSKITDLITSESSKNFNIHSCMTDEQNEDFWFLRRLNENVHFYSPL